MGLFDRYVVGDCGMLPTGSRSPHEREYREIYQLEKGIYGMSDAEVWLYLKTRPAHLIDPYGDEGDTLH